MTMLLPISQLRTDGGTQPRASLDENYICDLADVVSGGTDLPPVMTFHDGSCYWLADGFHRAHAYSKAGRQELPAEVKQGTRRDAVLYSVGANATHGQRRSNADKRRAVEDLLRDDEWRMWPLRRLAETAGVSHELVSAIRKDMSDSDKSTPPAEKPPAPGAARKRAERGERPPPSDVDDLEPDDEEEPIDQDDDDPVGVETEDDSAEEAAEVPAPVAAPPRSTGMSDLDVTLACVRGLNEDERAELFRRVGAAPFGALVALIEQRGRDPEYAQMRRISEPTPNATRGMRQVTAVLDGADVALAVLGCTWTSTADDVRRAYRSASLSAHPDRGGDPEVMARLNWAHGVVRSFVESKP